MKKTWFISDLHLDPSRAEIFTLLHQFLNDIEPQAEALYILGDLFEFWIGDDLINSPLGEPYLPILAHLKKLSDSGVKLYFTQGNRDFLIADGFLKATGATLLPDIQLIDLYGTPTLVLHGDTLCTDDKNYQRMRAFFRFKWVQHLYLMLSLERRARKANRVRKVTSKQVKEKDYSILGVNQQAVESLMKAHNVRQMIHGHTHRPAIHTFNLEKTQNLQSGENKECKRIVLGDWHDKASYLVASDTGIELIS